MLMRFDPYHELDRLLGPPLARDARPLTMPMDAYRDGDAFVVQLDLPGVDARSIDLTVEKNVLVVRAERSGPEVDEKSRLVSERPRGTFTRQLFLGEGLDSEKIEATYDAGVLTIRIPVAEQAKPRKVEVSASSSPATVDTTAA